MLRIVTFAQHGLGFAPANLYFLHLCRSIHGHRAAMEGSQSAILRSCLRLGLMRLSSLSFSAELL